MNWPLSGKRQNEGGMHSWPFTIRSEGSDVICRSLNRVPRGAMETLTGW
ncbi:hypothetical protein AC02_5136 [Escherichia coli 3-020-07_S3_C1]|nr:hypothetical protein AC02_5136 [Escherichia coli 3-020-07_S3_C1]